MKLVVDTGTRELIGAGDEFEAPRELMVRGELGEKGRGGERSESLCGGCSRVLQLLGSGWAGILCVTGWPQEGFRLTQGKMWEWV